MGFRPNYLSCIAHLYLYYTLLVPHTYASYIRPWCIFSYHEIQYTLPVFLTLLYKRQSIQYKYVCNTNIYTIQVKNVGLRPTAYYTLTNLFYIIYYSISPTHYIMKYNGNAQRMSHWQEFWSQLPGRTQNLITVHWCIKTWHMHGPKKDSNKLLYFIITNNQIVP